MKEMNEQHLQHDIGGRTGKMSKGTHTKDGEQHTPSGDAEGLCRMAC
jgi:hypothetical protein